MALNYLQGAPAGTMPSAVPGPSAIGDVLGAIQPGAGVPPDIASAVRTAMPVSAPGMPGLPPMPPGPEEQEYKAVTQSDGSILLHLVNPDGSLGPAVKIVNAIKPRQGMV